MKAKLLGLLLKTKNLSTRVTYIIRKTKPFIVINGENLIQQNDYKGDRRGLESNHGAMIISTVNMLLLCDTLGIKLTQDNWTILLRRFHVIKNSEEERIFLTAKK